MEAFLKALETLPLGYFKAIYKGAPYGVTVERLSGNRQIKLYAEALGGNDHVSFNLYLPTSGKVLLKPCEMAAEKVTRFVEGVQQVG